MPPTQPALSNNETLTNFVNDILDVSSIVMKRALQDGCRENQLYMAAAAGIATFTTAVMLGVPKDKALEAAIRTGITVNEAADAAVALSSKTKDAQTRVKKAIDVAASTLGKSAYNNVTGISAPKRGLVKANVERTVLKETIAPSTKEVRMAGGASPGDLDSSNLAWIFGDELQGGFSWSGMWDGIKSLGQSLGHSVSHEMMQETMGYTPIDPIIDTGVCPADFDDEVCPATDLQDNRGLIRRGIDWLAGPTVQIGVRALARASPYLERMVSNWWREYNKPPEEDIDLQGEVAKKIREQRDKSTYDVGWAQPKEKTVGQIVEEVKREHDINWANQYIKNAKFRDKVGNIVGNTWQIAKNVLIGAAEDAAALKQHEDHLNYLQAVAKTNQANESLMREVEFQKAHPFLTAFSNARSAWTRLYRKSPYLALSPEIAGPVLWGTAIKSYATNDADAERRLMRDWKQQPLPQAAVNYSSLFANNSPIPTSIPQTTVRAYPSSIPLSQTMTQPTGNKKVAVEPVQSVSATPEKSKTLKTKVETEPLASPYLQSPSEPATKKAKSVPVSKRETPSVMWVIPQEPKAERTERKTATKTSTKPSAMQKKLVRGAKKVAKVALPAAIKGAVAKKMITGLAGKALTALTAALI